MPVNITDSIAFTPTVQTIADGDAATQANFALGPQALSNRTAYLKDLLTNPSTGVQAIRNGTTAAMQSLSGMANGSQYLVPGYGLYTYNSTSVATIDSLLIFSATGGGRWIHQLQGVANASLGFPVIGTGGAAAGKLLQSLIPFGIVSITQSIVAFASTISASGYQLVTSVSVPSCLSQDRLFVFCSATIKSSSGSTSVPTAIAKMTVNENGGADSDEPGTRSDLLSLTANSYMAYSAAVSHLVFTNGTAVVKLQCDRQGNDVTIPANGASMTVIQVRA